MSQRMPASLENAYILDPEMPAEPYAAALENTMNMHKSCKCHF
jgi:hypothetical protein